MKKIMIGIFLICILVFIAFIAEQKTETEQPQNDISQTENKVQNVVFKEQTTLPPAQNTLDGKTIAFIGDSLIEGYGNDFHGFDYYLAKSLPNTSFINHSKSGSTITDNSGTDTIIMLNQAKTLQGNPDIIILDGGANDIMGYSLGFLKQELKKEIGTVDLATNTISNDETVISDLEEVIATLKNRFPNAQICYLQPFLLDEDTISHLCEENSQRQEIRARADAFYPEVQKMCDKWKIKYWDISSYIAGTGTTYRQDDWIHLKAEGYELLTPYLLENLKGATNEENLSEDYFYDSHYTDSYLYRGENVHHPEQHHN